MRLHHRLSNNLAPQQSLLTPLAQFNCQNGPTSARKDSKELRPKCPEVVVLHLPRRPCENSRFRGSKQSQSQSEYIAFLPSDLSTTMKVNHRPLPAIFVQKVSTL